MQSRGDELRHERLRDRGEDLLGAAAAEGLDRFAGSVVELFDGIGVELADHPHRMDAHGDDACRGAEAEHPQEHDGEHEVGNRSGEDDEGARRPLRTAPHPGGASGEEGDGDRKHDGEQSRQEHDRQGLDDKRDGLTERREVERDDAGEEPHGIVERRGDRGDVDAERPHRPGAGNGEADEHDDGDGGVPRRAGTLRFDDGGSLSVEHETHRVAPTRAPASVPDVAVCDPAVVAPARSLASAAVSIPDTLE